MVGTPIIVIRCNKYITDKERNELHRDLAEQYKSGIIVIPSYCSVEVPTAESEE